MSTALAAVLLLQLVMGGFDTLYHHEFTERLAWRASQARELVLHGVRNLAYALVFVLLGWSRPEGLWAAGLMMVMLAELGITLWDFVEEDRTRRLPASERITHTLLTLNYGVILALLLPWLMELARAPTALTQAHYGALSWLLAMGAVGVTLSGIRDLAASARCKRLTSADAAELATGLPAGQSILITGGTGFVGSLLTASLTKAGHRVIVLTRSPERARIASSVRLVRALDEISADERIDAVVNLAGEPISDTPWTGSKRLRIVRSRLQVTYGLVRLIKRLKTKPQVLVSGSAVGWYGLRDAAPLAEDAQGEPCFSRRVCLAWERAAARAAPLGTRTVLLRIGVVLDREGGMLARMLLPFELGLGGRFGRGRQWMSWIHRDDLVRLIVHCIASPLEGPVNATAPEPVTNAEFTARLAQAMRRPALAAIPAWPLRAALGDFAYELLLSGQRVLPRAALHSGFRFRYPTVQAALAQVVGSRAAAAATAACPAGWTPALADAHHA